MEIKAIETSYRGHRFRSRLEARWAVFFDALKVEWEYEKEGFELPSGRYLPDFWLPRVQVGCWFEVKGKEATEHEKQLARELAEGTDCPVYIFDGQIDAKLNVYNHNLRTFTIDYIVKNYNVSWSEAFIIQNAKEFKEYFHKYDELILNQPKGVGFFPQQSKQLIYGCQQFGICSSCGSINIVGGGANCYFPCSDFWWGEGQNPLPNYSRKHLLQKTNRTVFQEEIIQRHCKNITMEKEQLERLERAFLEARGARFEFGDARR